MKLLERKIGKRVLAFLLAFTMCVGLISAATPMDAEATGVMSSVDVVPTVPNGDFESGREGEEVPNWTKTAMLQSHGKETDEAKKEAYCNNYMLTTQVEDDGNQVAALAKTSFGYVAATSSRIAVAGGETYTLSFDYRTADMTGDDWKYGLRLYVEELDESGNVTAPISGAERFYEDTDHSTDWRTGRVTFKTQTNTASIVLYITIVEGSKIITTVHIDNVSLDVYRETGVLNGDFELGRSGYSVKYWSKTAMEANNKKTDLTNESRVSTFLNAYELVTASDGEDNEVASLSKVGTGYVGLTSQQVAVAGEKDYRIAFDYKTVACALKNATETDNGKNAYYGVRLLVEELDANGATIQVGGADLTEYFRDESTDTLDKWSTAYADMKTQSSTAYVIIYLWLGGGSNRQATVYFDNVTLEANDDYSVFNATFDDVTYKADGGRADGVAGPAGWTMVGSNASGKIEGATDSFKNHFKATVVEETGRGNVALLEYVASGYAMMQSPYIAVDGSQTCTVAADCKLIMNKADGTAVSLSNGKREIFLNLAYYDADKNFLGEMYSKQGATTNSEWKQLTTSAITTPAKTAYVRIGLYVALVNGDLSNDTTLSAEDIIAMKAFKLYYDDVVLRVDGEITDWTAETTNEAGMVRTSGDFTAYYDVRKESAGTGHEEALQLYVKRGEGILGGVTYYSEPIAVTAGASYTTSFDLKIEGSDASAAANVFGASYVLRYLDSEGNVMERKLDSGSMGKDPICLTGRLKENMDWTHYIYEVTAPENGASVQIGLVIGGYQKDILPNLTHTFDNIIFMESEAYEDYMKDPAVTSSALYKQSALFVGDTIGSGMAEVAASYSEMQVTNACSDTVPMEEQLLANGTGTFDYVIVSAGSSEIQAQIPAGTVTDATTYMGGVPFDAATFAGMLEQLFAKVAEYQEAAHVVYILPTDVADYQAVAQAAATKWDVTLVSLADTSNSTKNWNDAIAPAEEATAFDCYAIPGMLDYLEDVVEAVKAEESSLNNLGQLDDLLAKVNGCPDSNADYDGYMVLAATIQTMIAEYEAYYPLILGATIAEGDANQLRFMALSAKAELSSVTTVKKMVIRVTSVADGTVVLEAESPYTGAEVLFDAVLSGAKADPAAEYAAVAYVIYEEAGKEYTCYSKNDYTNTVGIKTSENGICVKSVYGIAQEIAVSLCDAVEDKLDFTAIGGKANQKLIATATEESEVSLHDVYLFVSNNEAILEEWLSEGGALQ